MPRQLVSRVFSTETLAAGLQLVKTEAGMSDLSDLNPEELEAELRALEAGQLPQECMCVCIYKTINTPYVQNSMMYCRCMCVCVCVRV